jgi:pyrroloquinoline quinone (PQQ) biosynthesis protein C
VTMNDVLRTMTDRIFQAQPVENHPLFRLLVAGRLARHEERAVGLDVYHVTAAFPRFLAAVAARIEDGARRAPFVENLCCEQGGANGDLAHLISYTRYLQGLGIPAQTIEQSRPSIAALAYIRSLFDLCAHQRLAEAVAALAVIEDIVARVSPTLVAYARARTGNAEAGEHFALHEQLDRAHAEQTYAECRLDHAIEPEAVIRGLALGLHYQWRLYSDLVELHVAPEKWGPMSRALVSPVYTLGSWMHTAS